MNSTNKIKVYWSDGRVDELPDGNSVIALGTFDGVHLAHARLIEEARALKDRISAKHVGAWSFSQAPASILLGKNIPLISTHGERVRLLLSLGLDFVAVGDFADFREMAAESFISSVLKEKLQSVGAVCGFNHRFGHMGKGSPELLMEYFNKDAVVTVPEIKVGGETVSSSAIRKKLINGDIEAANLMLGRCFSLTSKVISNKRLGHKLGFPTANQRFPSDQIVPHHGIYASRCILQNGKKYIGVSNVGVRPTISDGSDDHVVNCETYIHGFSDDIYGQILTVELCRLIREEKKFSSLNELKAAIAHDTEQAINYFDKNEL